MLLSFLKKVKLTKLPVVFTIDWMLDVFITLLRNSFKIHMNNLCWIKLFAVKLAVWEDVLDQYVQSIRWVPEVSHNKFLFTVQNILNIGNLRM